ncbi:ATP-binding cassette domain-containing protein, partial [Streptococcus sobrinus]
TGEINYEGENIKTLNKDRLRQQIGVVPQDPLLFNNSIKENLTQSLDIPEDDINDALRKVSMYDFIQSLPMKLNTV